jgi:hypothetical protein
MLPPPGEPIASLPLRTAVAQRPTTFSKSCFEGWVVCDAAQPPQSAGPHPPPQADPQQFEDLLWPPLSAPELYLNRLLRRFAPQNASVLAKPLPVQVCTNFEAPYIQIQKGTPQTLSTKGIFLAKVII